MPRDTIPRHEFCFWLHDQAARLLVEASQSGQIEDWHEAVADALANVPDGVDRDDVLIALAETGGTICTPMKVDILAAILSDTLHFIYEALKALEKRKFNVAFSLLRKPLTENLIILSKLVSDDDGFIRSFADGSLQRQQVMQIDVKQRIELFEKAISFLPIKSLFNGELINDIIFNKNMPNGLQIRMQQATHLITTRHASLLTPKMGINRIFFNQHGDENYSVYDTLPVLLFLILQMAIQKFSTYLTISSRSTNEIMLRALGIYGNIYEGRLDALSHSLNREMKEFFHCEWCSDGNAKIRKDFAADFYLNDQIYCTKCKRHSHTPLTYILRSGKLDISESDTRLPSEYEKLFMFDKDQEIE